MITYIIEFVTMSARTIVKTVKANNEAEACHKLDMKYNIAYFNEIKILKEATK